jgi:hypothetical protein
MTIPEAARLVLQAAAIGESGQVLGRFASAPGAGALGGGAPDRLTRAGLKAPPPVILS